MERREEPSKEKAGNNQQYKEIKKRKGENDLRSDARSVPVKISLVGESKGNTPSIGCVFILYNYAWLRNDSKP